MSDTVLSVSGMRKTFGKTVALDGASLELKRGEHLALLGPNGAGKTTLVRAIAGRVRADDGAITILGHDDTTQNRATVLNGKLGIVPQDLAVYPMLTARENLKAFGTFNGVPPAELDERIAWALDWTGLAPRADDLSNTFSGGMKRRLNIACAVLHRPEILLLDEPTVGVDPQSRQRIWEMLEELRRHGASLLLTTHQLDEAQRLCDRIVIIDHGKDIAAGSLDELIEQTVGVQKRVQVRLEQVPEAALLERGFTVDDHTATRLIDDVAKDIPALLESIQSAGGVINDMHIESPTLQAVFIHLTGRELRE